MPASSRQTTARRRRRTPRAPPQNHVKTHQHKLLDAKIAETQELARSFKTKLLKKKENEVIDQEFKDLDKPIDEEELEQIMSGVIEPPKASPQLLPLSEKDKQLKLFDSPARGIDINQQMLIKIGDSVQNIMNKDNLKWDVVIDDLYRNKDGFKGLTKTDVYQFLCQIPNNTKLPEQTISQLEQMLKDVSIGLTKEASIMMNFYANNAQISQMETMYHTLIAGGQPPAENILTLMIKGYVNAKDLKKVNEMLVEMQKQQYQPGLKTYTNILQLCVKLQAVKQGEQVFQMMKFHSLQTKPDILAYNNMIQLQVKNKDAYKAVDYYEELSDVGLTPNTYTFNALALACSKDKNFILKGWNYIEEISKRHLEPNLVTFQVMLRLAASDGDLELARALALKIDEILAENLSNQNLQESERIKKETLNYLMIAYRDFKPDHVPQSVLSKEISIIRRNTLRLADFTGLHQTIVNDSVIAKKRENLPPFLPLRNLYSQRQIVSEAHAIWNYSIIKTPGCLNRANLITFLRVLVDQGASKREFLQSFDQFTYANEEISKPAFTSLLNQGTIVESSKDSEVQIMSTVETTEPATTTLPPVLRIVKERFGQKLERETQLYRTLLSAGKRYKDLEMCETAWVERGQYRNTEAFKSLPRHVQEKKNFEFAKEMVLSMTDLNELELAVKTVSSTRTLFPWNFYLLNPLYQKLKDNGFTELCQDISFICNTAPRKNYKN
ncbi:hypothetical protein WICPIJ_008737 [Wickerhamomyces pijperi]|uniref:Mitochondrial group I intron splicing factor CCM1 n=1 Tax=Wickerhamomyces pijperi TaxID=599730 RepID=A0A9P8THM5_WICPI|nr:hypothetical protein WICPIJ_008737 [Wickerhamomyces pijperi]